MFTRSTDRYVRSFLLLALPAVLAACSSEPQKTFERVRVDAPTTVVEPVTIPSVRAVAGVVRSSNVSPLSARVIGNVIRVHVSEGDGVRTGQLLVEIDSRDARSQADRARAGGAELERAIEAAKAHASLAEATWRRYAALRERQSVSQQELDETRTRYEATGAELARLVARRDEVRAATDQATTFLDYSFVRSPIDGVVTRRFIDPGAQAAPGMPLLAVEDATSFRVEASVPESLQLRAGDAVTIESDGRRLPARVAHVQPSLDGKTRSSLVKIALDPEPGTSSPLRRSGQYVRVLFPTGVRTAIVVPPSAVVRRGQLTSVFVVDTAGIARMRLVTVGEEGEILSGLEAGERIVTDPRNVTDGAAVS